MKREACEDIRELLPLHADDALSAGDAATVRAHLAACDPCRREFERWATLDRMVTAGLTAPEPVSDMEIEAAVERVRRVKAVWEVAPAAVRFWRSWTPPAALAAAAALLVAIGFLVPGLTLERAETAIIGEASAVAVHPRDVAQGVADEVVGLHASAHTWPRRAVVEATRQWNEGLSLSQDVIQRLGLAPLAACALLLVAANLMIARSVRTTSRTLQGG